jgi:hypothetical protein
LVYFRSKALLIAGGASQGFHPSIYNWFPSLQTDKSRLISSDSFLKKWVYLDQVSKLRRMQDKAGYKDGKPVKSLNIVIIGGSHSGFSCAWMLLNGPSLFQTNSLGITTANGKAPQAMRKAFLNCQTCCGCEDELTRLKKCNCVCKCFGFFKYDDWGVSR